MVLRICLDKAQNQIFGFKQSQFQDDLIKMAAVDEKFYACHRKYRKHPIVKFLTGNELFMKISVMCETSCYSIGQ